MLFAQPTWAEIETARMKREDDAIARKYFAYKHLGIGHLRPELCRVPWDY